MHIIIIFIFGLMVGSFLNAVIHRLKVNESIVFDRSRCVHCRHTLGTIDLLPLVSFIMLSGRCRYCRKPISWQYPAVEALTGLIFVLAALKNPYVLSFNYFETLVFSSVFLVIAAYDLKHFLILDKIVFPAVVLSLAANVYMDKAANCSLVSLHCSFMSGIVGAILISLFFLLQYIFSNGRWIGFGDVKLGLLLGSVTGIWGGVLTLILAYVTGSIVGVGLMVMGRKKMSSSLPFGTFLSISAIITMIYGPMIIRWYAKLIGL